MSTTSQRAIRPGLNPALNLDQNRSKTLSAKICLTGFLSACLYAILLGCLTVFRKNW